MGPEEQSFTRQHLRTIGVQGQGGSTLKEEEAFHPNSVTKKAQVAPGDNMTLSSLNHLMGTMTLSNKIEDEEHQAIQIVNMDEEDHPRESFNDAKPI